MLYRISSQRKTSMQHKIFMGKQNGIVIVKKKFELDLKYRKTRIDFLL